MRLLKISSYFNVCYFFPSVGCASGVVSQHIRLNGANIQEQHCTFNNDEGMKVCFNFGAQMKFDIPLFIRCVSLFGIIILGIYSKVVCLCICFAT